CEENLERPRNDVIGFAKINRSAVRWNAGCLHQRGRPTLGLSDVGIHLCNKNSTDGLHLETIVVSVAGNERSGERNRVPIARRVGQESDATGRGQISEIKVAKYLVLSLHADSGT